MLGMFKQRIITHLTEEQFKLLPVELWENIENKTISNTCVLYDTIFNDILSNDVIVKLIDYYNSSVLDTILINDFNKTLSFNKIKLSSDSKYLIYIDISYNINFYDIFLKQISYSKNLGFININLEDADESKICYYFDNNGCRFIISYDQITEVFDIQTSEKLLTINFLTSDHKFNKDYTRLICNDVNTPVLYVYDMDKKEHYSTINNVMLLSNISDSGKYVIADSAENYSDNFALLNIETNTVIMEFNNSNSESGLAVSYFTFSNDEKYVAAHYFDGRIIICDINSGHIVKEFIDEDFLFRGIIKIEFTYDNKYIIIRNNDTLIRIYDWINERFVAEYGI